MVLLLLATAGLALALCSVLQWPEAARGRALITLAAAVFYPSLISLVLGQITAICLLLLVGAVLAAKRGRGTLAGGLLAASTIKPQLVWLAIPLLLRSAPSDHRRRQFAGFTVTLATLGGVGVLWEPAWPLHFVRNLAGYAEDEPTPSALLLVGHLLVAGRLDSAWTGVPGALAVFGGIGLVAGTLVWWWRARPDEIRTLSVALAVTLAVTPLRAQTAQMALLVPLLCALRWLAAPWSGEWRARQAWVVTAAGLLLIGGSWVVPLSRADPPDFLTRQLAPVAGLLLAYAGTRGRPSVAVSAQGRLAYDSSDARQAASPGITQRAIPTLGHDS
jgi:hypothetical protein